MEVSPAFRHRLDVSGQGINDRGRGFEPQRRLSAAPYLDEVSAIFATDRRKMNVYKAFEIKGLGSKTLRGEQAATVRYRVKVEVAEAFVPGSLTRALFACWVVNTQRF